MREGGDGEDDGDAEDADEQPDEVGRPVDAGGEQGLVHLDLVGRRRGVVVVAVATGLRGLRVLWGPRGLGFPGVGARGGAAVRPR
ncbi:hypothetical protein GCM10010336_05240 [Streptomyces goshikiensis]|nr:hypothetical protein GCM10010336_05240 [Streptomyces goshikiensis]